MPRTQPRLGRRLVRGDPRWHHLVRLVADRADGKGGTPHYVGTYDHATGTAGARRRLATSPDRSDPHDKPGICLDTTGYLHVIAGGHGSPALYTRSLAPLSATTGWTVPVPVLSTGWASTGDPAVQEGRQTYPAFVCDSRDTLHLVTRQGRRGVDPYHDGKGYAALVHQSCAAGGAWSEPSVVVAGAYPGYGSSSTSSRSTTATACSSRAATRAAPSSSRRGRAGPRSWCSGARSSARASTAAACCWSPTTAARRGASPPTPTSPPRTRPRAERSAPSGAGDRPWTGRAAAEPPATHLELAVPAAAGQPVHRAGVPDRADRLGGRDPRHRAPHHRRRTPLDGAADADDRRPVRRRRRERGPRLGGRRRRDDPAHRRRWCDLDGSAERNDPRPVRRLRGLLAQRLGRGRGAAPSSTR